ncbi:AglZ/HisF2 family acetamidino modification protein [Aliarcobacter cryaerophilus]|uniref:AglZ/HisF2 family acetamidino modification protein n=1 Tax=Aliarcobacter cryaerophilus TaxID=28198 RepID=UPI0021B65CD2|nr:AglZ/HisF2 family acetamidino modification protein [Aliarcobacter cryaerophilus]MCT7405750.1 AglZ/HisF2 family acetamidino modification protein [Aliarcobacter cryaerophilus]MCT7503307.1 AglZ/HisF2 family acetamidino modification protein [Aliarcobacter cryaerophilus]
MLQKRIIPCLLLHKGGLYKTQNFKKPTYIGDPINAIKIFNEKEVDELMFLDIDATVQNKEPNYKMIEDIASECFMPLCYGGGVKTLDQMKKIYSLGVEKISISSAAIENPNLIQEAANIFGNQSVIVTVDIKKDFFGKKKVFINNGKKNTKINPVDFIKRVEALGAGEIVVNSIDHDGVMKGYDIELLKEIKSNTKIPIIALGGAGNLNHIKEIFEISKVDAVACGSMFVYQGPLKGVLISYPPYQKIQELLN